MRGATVLLMVLVNNPGSWGRIFPPLKHAAWHGCTPTDLVFPFFLFIVGVSIPLSQRAQLDKGRSSGELQVKILKRGLILFALGVLMSMWPFVRLDGSWAWRVDFSTFRIPGVLARIAVCYAVAASCVLWLSRRATLALLWTLLLGYWAILRFVPVAQFGAFAIDDPATHLGCVVDRWLLGDHVWSYTRKHGYDPEGVLSTLPAIATCLFGVYAGQRLTGLDRWRVGSLLPQRLLSLFAAGTGLCAIGYLWSYELPVNKQLWTSSYTALTAGMAMLVLACYARIADDGEQRATSRLRGMVEVPVLAFGRNAILMFVASGLLAKTLSVIKLPLEGGTTSLRGWLYSSLFVPLAGESAVGARCVSLAWAVAYVGLFAAIAVWLDRRRIYFKV